MKEFDYVIIGGGCAGLSLAYELEINDKFTISYFAKKHNKRIFRKGLWTDLSREWVSKKGDKLLTYYDLTNQGYRTAKGKYTLIAVGGNDDL